MVYCRQVLRVTHCCRASFWSWKTIHWVGCLAMRTKNLLQVSAMHSASSRSASIATKSYASTILHMTSSRHKTHSTHACMQMWWSSCMRTPRTLRTLTPTGMPESSAYFTSMFDTLAQKGKIQHPNTLIFSGCNGSHAIEMSSLAGPCTIFHASVSTLKVSLRHLASSILRTSFTVCMWFRPSTMAIRRTCYHHQLHATSLRMTKTGIGTMWICKYWQSFNGCLTNPILVSLTATCSWDTEAEVSGTNPFTKPPSAFLMTISVLKSGLVWSFTPILRKPDRNQSFDFLDLRQPDWDRSRPVHLSPHSGPNWLQPVFTKTSSQPIQSNIYEY